MKLLAFIVNLLSDRPLPGDSARVAYVATRAPQIADEIAADDHALAGLMRDVCIDIRVSPTPEHQRLLTAVRNGDDGGLACEFRILIARYLLDEAKDRASAEFSASERLEHAARATSSRSSAPRPSSARTACSPRSTSPRAGWASPTPMRCARQAMRAPRMGTAARAPRVWSRVRRLRFAAAPSR
jgi:hypothetical protein